MTALLLIAALNALQDLCWTGKTVFIATEHRVLAIVCDWIGNAIAVAALGMAVLTFSPGAILAYASGGSMGAALGLLCATLIERHVGVPVPHPLRRRLPKGEY